MMQRMACFEKIAAARDGAIVVATYTSAFEWHRVDPNPLNFVSVGAMGQASSHGLGLAIGLPTLPHKLVAELASYRVVVVNGRLRPDLCALGELPDDVLVAGLEDLLTAAPERLEPYLGKIIREGDMPMAALNIRLSVVPILTTGLMS